MKEIYEILFYFVRVLRRHLTSVNRSCISSLWTKKLFFPYPRMHYNKAKCPLYALKFQMILFH